MGLIYIYKLSKFLNSQNMRAFLQKLKFKNCIDMSSPYISPLETWTLFISDALNPNILLDLILKGKFKFKIYILIKEGVISF